MLPCAALDRRSCGGGADAHRRSLGRKNNVSHSGWYSGNPTLGPNNLTDLVCGGSTCYAAGAFGTLLKSTNAGSTWSGVVTNLTLDLRRAHGGSRTGSWWAAAARFAGPTTGGATFQRLPFSASDLECPAGSGPSRSRRRRRWPWFSGNNTVLSTADGGQTFTRRTAVPVGPPTDLLTTGRDPPLRPSAVSSARRTARSRGRRWRGSACRSSASSRRTPRRCMRSARPSSCSRARTAVRRGSEGGGECTRR